jgi:hypothetical protein|tara:strand:+ start:2062 stop:2367 length:306 start_codon:yes stop_codon:yes gene_type:complete
VANNADKIRDINSVGWDGLDANVHQLRINDINEQQKLDIAYSKCFQTNEGKAVLEHLIQITLDQPCWVPGADSSYGYAREGQNSIIREIQQRIRRANEPSE